MLKDKRVLLIISGGIAAYKCLDLIRNLREQGARVRCVMTKSANEFITKLSVSALSGEKVYSDLFSLTDENEMGHIQLSRESDILVVAPATANILARMAQGLADDLATTVLLATNKKVLVAPSMNNRMWTHQATQQNIAILQERGISVLGPGSGEMACGEHGEGRMLETQEILEAIKLELKYDSQLFGLRALVTSGPTHEPIDPVRYLGNRSSGKQGHAIATAIARLGAETTLVTGPTNEPEPLGVQVIHVETAQEMLTACKNSLPTDIAICAAAVADWRFEKKSKVKLKKKGQPPTLSLIENPDILKTLSQPGNKRPRLVIGFAAETENIIVKGTQKLSSKGCDWIIANDVSPNKKTFGNINNTINFITSGGIESWPKMSKQKIATKLAERIVEVFATSKAAE